MGRGGIRTPGIDPATGQPKKMGRPRNTIEAAAPKLGKGFASRVFGRFKELNLKAIDLKDKNGQPKIITSAEDYALDILAAQDAEAKIFFKYMIDRIEGKPVQPTFQKDTREGTRPEVDFGDICMPAAPGGQPGATGKPN